MPRRKPTITATNTLTRPARAPHPGVTLTLVQVAGPAPAITPLPLPGLLTHVTTAPGPWLVTSKRTSHSHYSTTALHALTRAVLRAQHLTGAASHIKGVAKSNPHRVRWLHPTTRLTLAQLPAIVASMEGGAQ